MKSIAFIIAAILIVPKLWSMEDGLYEISDAAHPRLIDDLVGKTSIYSVKNDNTFYQLSLSARDEFPFPVEKMELVLSNRTVRFGEWGGENGKEITMLATPITNREVALLAAGHFHTNVMDRYHPGHQMLVQFIPAKGEFSTNEPVMVKLRITNVGKADFAYRQGGSQRGARDNQFAFTAEQVGDKMLPDVGDPMNFGGPAGIVSLKPGESHELSVDLKKWFNFTAGGSYFVRGSYDMSFCDPVSKDFQTIWEDFACARFEIRIKK